MLILTPTGRDAEGAATLLSAEGIESRIYPTLPALRATLDDTAGAVLLADEALFRADLNALAARLAAQPPWSELARHVGSGWHAAAKHGRDIQRMREIDPELLELIVAGPNAGAAALRKRQRQRRKRR